MRQATNIKTLPKEFTSYVKVINLNVATKSMYVNIEGTQRRITVPSHIDAAAIDGTTVDFYIKGVATLMIHEQKSSPLTGTSEVGDIVTVDDKTYTVLTAEYMPDDTIFFKLASNSAIPSMLTIYRAAPPRLVQPRFLVGDIVENNVKDWPLTIIDVSTILFDRTVYLTRSSTGFESTYTEAEFASWDIVYNPRTTTEIWDELEATTDVEARAKLHEEYVLIHQASL